MPIKVKSSGKDKIKQNVDAKTKALAEAFANGIKLAGLHLQKKSQIRTPVEFGLLRGSAYTRHTGVGFDTRVEVGYTAPYAGAVHELVEMKLKGKPRPSGLGTYWSPKGTAKFLEDPAKEESLAMKNIILKEMKKVTK